MAIRQCFTVFVFIYIFFFLGGGGVLQNKQIDLPTDVNFVLFHVSTFQAQTTSDTRGKLNDFLKIGFH